MHKFLLVGNANTGKTTLFNSLSKSNEHTGNWHGVTNQEKVAKFKFEKQIYEVVDLPGIYSMTPHSFEEKVATDYIYANLDCPVINICDLNNIQRNLFLTLELIELGMKVFLVINQMDKKPFNNVDVDLLKNELGCPVFLLDASNKKQVANLKAELSKINEFEFKLPYNYIGDVDYNLHIKKQNVKINKKYLIIKLYENDKYLMENYLAENVKIPDLSETFAKKRYEFIATLKSIKHVDKKVYGYSGLDKILLNKYLALPIFISILLCIFYLTFFSLGAFISNFLQYLIQDLFGSWFIHFISSFVKTQWIVDLFDVALIGGIGSILSFLPQVTLLFFFLAILEDSGYLSRVAFLFEDIFSKVGLSGKGVYTLLMGFGCSASAILTSRNMEDKNAKIKTALMTPFMSCSAKLPIYAVLGGAFFGAGNVVVVLGLYLLGVVLGLTLCYILEKTSFKSKQQSFILEFAHLRFAKPNRIFAIIFDNLKQFLIRIGSLLICVNVIIWLLSSFSFRFGYVQFTGEKSMLQVLGELLCFIFKPLGFGNWGATSALIAGLVAKEVVVSSIAIFNGVSGGENQISKSLSSPSSVVFFTPASALAYMAFCLLYTPCIATLGVLKNEIGTKLMLFSVILQFSIAYLIAFLVFKISSFIELLGIFQTVLIVCAVLFIVFCIIFVLSKKRCLNCNYCKKKCKKIKKDI